MFDYLIFDIFLTTWHFDTFNLNHLSPHRAIFFMGHELEHAQEALEMCQNTLAYLRK